MEVLSLSMMLLASSLFGIAVDTYWYPKSIDIEIVDRDESAVPGIGIGTVGAIVQHQIDRMATTASLVARPHIRPSKEQGFVSAVGEVTGLTPFINLVRNAFQDRPDRLTLGVYQEAGKLAVYGSGSTADLPRRFELFEIDVRQDDGETMADTIRRATVLGVSRLDPYLAMLHLLAEEAKTGDTRYGDRSFAIIDTAKRFFSGLSGRSSLLARTLNVEGLLHLRRGDTDKASASFTAGLTHTDSDSLEVTQSLLRMNRAIIEIVHGDSEAAAAALARLLADTGNFGKRFGARVVSSENVVFSLATAEVEFIRSYAETLQAALAIRRGRLDEAESYLARALKSFPDQIAAISLLADLKGARGDVAAERAHRDTVIARSLAGELFHEAAIAHMRLVYAGGALSLVADTPGLNR